MNHFFRTVVCEAGEGGRRPEGGIQTQRLSRLTAAHEPSAYPAWHEPSNGAVCGPSSYVA